MVRQGSPERSRRVHHERNQPVTVRPELVEGLNQGFLSVNSPYRNFSFVKNNENQRNHRIWRSPVRPFP